MPSDIEIAVKLRKTWIPDELSLDRNNPKLSSNLATNKSKLVWFEFSSGIANVPLPLGTFNSF